LKRGTGKYKGMLPLKCFNCGKIGHFANKCPYAKKSDSDEEEDPKKEKKYQKGNKKGDKRKVFKKNLYSREDSSSSDEDDESDSDSERVLFMATENKKRTLESEEEGEVDLEEELISALTELKKERKKNKSFKEENISLKTQLEEGKRKEEVMQIQMIKKEKECEKLEKEIMTLRVEVNKLNKNLKSSQVLENILNSQRPYSDKYGLGYKNVHFEEGSSSMTKETKQKSYAEVLKGRNHSQQESERNEYKRPSTFRQQRSFNHDEGINKENIMINQGRNSEGLHNKEDHSLPGM
jgi:hypothetical protein